LPLDFLKNNESRRLFCAPFVEMKRQKVLKKRSFLLNDDDRLRLLQDLALEIYGNPFQSLTFDEARKRIERDLKPPKHELEAHTRDFLTNSFLIRQGDEYRLSHKSILEYLVAMRLNKEIEFDNPEVFGTFLIDYQVNGFLKELEPNTETLFKWIQLTKEGVESDRPWLGTNAANLLHLISSQYFAGRDLSGTSLTNVNFLDADLKNTNLNDARLSGAELVGAKFFRKDIVLAKIDKAHVSLYISVKEGVFDFPSRELQNELDLFARPISSFRNDLLSEIVITVKNISHLEFARERLSAAFSTKVAVYYNECEELAREQEFT
jgi:pentapeptide repeat protein